MPYASQNPIPTVKATYISSETSCVRRVRMIFAACGVTDGTLLKGVRFFGGGARTNTLVMALEERKVRFIDTVHLERRPDLRVRFF